MIADYMNRWGLNTTICHTLKDAEITCLSAIYSIPVQNLLKVLFAVPPRKIHFPLSDRWLPEYNGIVQRQQEAV